MQLDFPARALGRRELERVLSGWTRNIPVGDAVHRGRGRAAPASLIQTPLSTGALEHQRERLVTRHLGTLGEGTTSSSSTATWTERRGCSSTPVRVGWAPRSALTT